MPTPATIVRTKVTFSGLDGNVQIQPARLALRSHEPPWLMVGAAAVKDWGIVILGGCDDVTGKSAYGGRLLAELVSFVTLALMPTLARPCMVTGPEHRQPELESKPVRNYGNLRINHRTKYRLTMSSHANYAPNIQG